MSRSIVFAVALAAALTMSGGSVAAEPEDVGTQRMVAQKPLVAAAEVLQAEVDRGRHPGVRRDRAGREGRRLVVARQRPRGGHRRGPAR